MAAVFIVIPFVPNASLETENFTVFCCFQGVEKGYIGIKWVNFERHLTKYLGYYAVLLFRFLNRYLSAFNGLEHFIPRVNVRKSLVL